MATHSNRSDTFSQALSQIHIHRGLVFGAIIVTALLAFEIFNYSTTAFALGDLLGDVDFLNIRWATILAIAFCSIDFAGIARLFAPEIATARNENMFLFGAWMLAATMNAMLTWWGVSLAILGHQTAGSEVIARETMLRVGPIFVAVLVWLIRVMIIGTFSVAGERLFTLRDDQPRAASRSSAQNYNRATPAMPSQTQSRPAHSLSASSSRAPTSTTSSNRTSAPTTSTARPPSTRSMSAAPSRPSSSIEVLSEPEEPPLEPTYIPAASLHARPASQPARPASKPLDSYPSSPSSAPRKRY
jgi:hypothetical protein